VKRRRWLWDALALLTLLAYGSVVRYTERGAADPVWTAIAARGVLRVGTDPGFRPFTEERGGALVGYDVDLVREVGRRLGLRVEFVPVAYDGLYDALSTGRVDLLAAALPLAPEQGWRAAFSTPYLNAGQLLVVGAGSSVTDEGQLSGRRVGVALGSDGDTFARKLRLALPDMALDARYESPQAALDALAAGAVDAAIVDAVSALTGAAQHPGLRITRALTFEPYVVAVPVAAYQLQRAVNGALAAMQSDGTIERLNAEWFR
jgi:polar amino acid transport system substrate-binding protein